MSIVLRGSKGSALTFAELDNNFSELSSGIAAALAYSDSAILPAVSQSLHVGTIVASTIYDTSKDSDGGAWRKRCQHTSWYTETLGGSRWIGQQASIAEAWAAAGSTTGAVFQASATAGPLTIGKYYAATSVTAATEVLRGIRAEFPAVVAVVAETGRVVIYDMTLPVPTMWMVANRVSGGRILGNINNYINCIAFSHSVLWVGTGSPNLGFLSKLDFAKDFGCSYADNGNAYNGGSIATRNTTGSHQVTGAGPTLTNRNVNSIAAAVLPGAPVDPATGLPVPTIAVATAGGVSVIKSDGSVVSRGFTTNSVTSVALTGDRLTAGSIVHSEKYSAVWSLSNFTTSTIATIDSPDTQRIAFYGPASSPALPLGNNGAVLGNFATAASTRIYGGNNGLTLLSENPSIPAKGMVAYITAAYPGMWQVGDSKRAWLCDATAETVTGSELVTNGTFATDTTGWTAEYSAALSVVSATMRVTAASGFAGFSQIITTVAGKAYSGSISITANSAAKNVFLSVRNTNAGGPDLITQVDLGSVATTYNFSFTATSAASCVLVTGSSGWASGETYDVDNISVRLAEPDRSVKSKHLPIYGSLTKTMVGGVAMYSGFSASNYLEEAYSSDLDIGTGDGLLFMGWLKSSPSYTDNVYHRALAGQSGGFLIQLGVSGIVELCATASTTFTTITTSSAGAFPPNTVALLTVFRSSGVIYVYANDRQVASVANTANLTYANAVARVGGRQDAAEFIHGSVALVRIGGTAPSADQIAQIYRDELALFQTGASGTLAGSSSAVTALSYDSTTDLTHIGTATHRSSFKGLVRVSSEATPSGAITSISAARGVLLTGGTSAYVAAPAVTVREAIEGKFKRVEQPVVQDYDAVTGQTTFVLPKGYTALTVKSAGTLKREGSTKDWTRSFDGYQESVVFGTAPGNTVWVQIEMVRA